MTNQIHSQKRNAGHTAAMGFGLAALAALLLAAPAASAQATVSTFTVPISTTVSAAASGLPEAVTFVGNAQITATVVTDPVLPPQVVVGIDGLSVIGTGQTSGLTYKNECEANLTRPLTTSDTIHLTFAVFKDGPGSALTAKTGLLTLNLTYNTTTMVLTNVTGNVTALPTTSTASTP